MSYHPQIQDSVPDLASTALLKKPLCIIVPYRAAGTCNIIFILNVDR